MTMTRFLFPFFLFLAGLLFACSDGSPAPEKPSWIYMKSFSWTMAKGPVILRSAGEFGAEVFCADGVFTVPLRRLPGECAAHLEKTSPPKGNPPEFLPDDKSYEFFKTVHFGDRVEELTMSLGAIRVGRPGFDAAENKPFCEYYWQMPSGGYFGVITMDEKVVEKLLWKTVPERKGSPAPLQDLFEQ